MDKPIRTLLGMIQHRPQRQPPSKTAEEWQIHWQSQGQLWRTEPEIDGKRQKELDHRRAIVPDIQQGIYPFKGMKLSRADVEWLLATHENGRGPMDWNDESQREREGLDLRGALLQGVDLHGLPLAHLKGGRWGPQAPQFWATVQGHDDHGAGMQLQKADLKDAQLQGASLSSAQLQGADLQRAQLQKADLRDAQLQEANLVKAWLQEAHLSGAHLQEAELSLAQLQGADLVGAQLQKARLIRTQLQGADLLAANFYHTDLYGAQLQGARLIGAEFEKTQLGDTRFADTNGVGPRVADIFWGETNLAVVDWSPIKILGDEYEARQKRYSEESGPDLAGKTKDKKGRLMDYEVSVRANRQLAVVLQNQGLDEDARRFAYRAQILQRKILWQQRNFWKWLGSAILALLAGYGYRMWRILVAYAIIVSLCAVAYFVIGMYHAPHLSLLQAFLESITAFHGRVFYELFTPDTPQIWVTAFEAVAGLLIEGVFIAMLTQRFFGK
jgi:uncharacterized protein YjbI with pentapeptide repeats